MDRLPAPFVELLRRQCGTFTRTQAYAHGVTRGFVDAQLAARRWRRITRGVLAAFTGPLHDRHRAWTAVLLAGEGAALSHESAAHRYALIRRTPAALHVVVPAVRKVRPATGVVVHRTRAPVSAVGAPPTTDVASTLCDLCADGARGDRLAAMVSSAVQRRLVTEQSLARALEDRGAFGGRSELRGLLRDAGEGAHSALEIRYLRDVERRHGLPRGVRQHSARHADDPAIRDIHYATFGLTVELDGHRDHGSFTARLRDARRDRLAADEGELTLRYGWWDVAPASCAVAAELATVFRGRGWSDEFRECPSCGTSDMP